MNDFSKRNFFLVKVTTTTNCSLKNLFFETSVCVLGWVCELRCNLQNNNKQEKEAS